jgi:hypothetical protein
MVDRELRLKGKLKIRNYFFWFCPCPKGSPKEISTYIKTKFESILSLKGINTLLFFSLVMCCNLFGQTLRFDKNQIQFGGIVNLINQGKDTQDVNLDAFINLEYGLDSNKIDSIADVEIMNADQQRSYSLQPGDTLRLKVFSPGRLYLAGPSDSLILNVLPLQQVTDYVDIKNIETVEVSIVESLLKWMMIILVLAALIFAIYKYMQKKKKVVHPIKEVIEVPLPYQEVALTALKKLHNEKRYEEPDTNAFQVEFTNVFKSYLGQEYKVNSLEMTTDELLSKLKNSAKQDELVNYRNFLSIADMVKFAKAKPGAEIQKDVLEQAIHLVSLKYEKSV